MAFTISASPRLRDFQVVIPVLRPWQGSSRLLSLNSQGALGPVFVPALSSQTIVSAGGAMWLITCVPLLLPGSLPICSQLFLGYQARVQVLAGSQLHGQRL